jgi:DNA repair exonuclease SbcCD ATPase subunit
MDANNVAHLSDSLQAYAAKVRGKRQVIMITHAEGLRHAFDHVIEIGPQAG